MSHGLRYSVTHTSITFSWWFVFHSQPYLSQVHQYSCIAEREALEYLVEFLKIYNKLDL